MLESIKQHPILFIGGGVGCFVIIMMLRANSGAAEQSVMSVNGGSTAGDATALQMAQIQTQFGVAQLAAGSRSEEIAAALEAAKINAQSSENVATMALSARLAEINATSQIQTTHDTLSAHVAESQINADLEKAAYAKDTTIASVNAVAGALTANVMSNTALGLATINANKKDCGWLGKLTGC